ncbi:MAG TPA: hypothetical protein VEH57_00885 [Thermoplasmata archaeon]|nr:hypothetical protein [Thermoplasmata archaeon]
MLRETTFLVGGALTIALGVALGAGLLWAGAGWDYVGAWLAAGMAVGFGWFFVYVARDEGRQRRQFLREQEKGEGSPRSPRGR